MTAVINDDLPRDPDMDDLPRELAERTGPFTIRARDPETGETYEAQTTREDVATGLADLRRSREDDAGGSRPK
jgi:hypothetical protein